MSIASSASSASSASPVLFTVLAHQAIDNVADGFAVVARTGPGQGQSAWKMWNCGVRTRSSEPIGGWGLFWGDLERACGLAQKGENPSLSVPSRMAVGPRSKSFFFFFISITARPSLVAGCVRHFPGLPNSTLPSVLRHLQPCSSAFPPSDCIQHCHWASL